MNPNVERVKTYLERFGLSERVVEFNDVSTATVPLAAQAIGCLEAQIAKSISLKNDDNTVILIVAAGDGKIDNSAFKKRFAIKPSMLKGDEVLEKTSYPIGGVCPFDLPEHVQVYLDVSLKRFDTIYPACGSSASMARLNCEELEQATNALAWVDVCKGWKEDI